MTYLLNSIINVQDVDAKNYIVENIKDSHKWIDILHSLIRRLLRYQLFSNISMILAKIPTSFFFLKILTR